MPKNLFTETLIAIQETDLERKCSTAQLLCSTFSEYDLSETVAIERIETPGLPPNLNLVSPRKLKKRGMQSQQGRNILMHAIAHIEFNAINLALDAVYRFQDQPLKFYRDWLNVAADEASHFCLIQQYLKNHGCGYGEFPAHNGLWDMALKTQEDIVARMALVPRVMEARGLDVTPTLIDKLLQFKDYDAADILTTIYHDEINHVKIGSMWFKRQCELRRLEPNATFLKMIDRHLHGQIKGPLNTDARLLAGFDKQELVLLNNQNLNAKIT